MKDETLFSGSIIAIVQDIYIYLNLYNLKKSAAHDQHKFPSFQAITIKVFPHRRLWYWFVVAGRKRNFCVHNRNSNFIVYSCMVKCETLLPAFSTIYELEEEKKSICTVK